MKIEESRVNLNARHEAECSSSTEVAQQASFRTVLRRVDGSEATAAPDGDKRVRLLLEELIAAMLALLSGEKCSGGLADVRAAVDAERGADTPVRVREFEWRRESTERIREHEATDFSAGGTVRISDGRVTDGSELFGARSGNGFADLARLDGDGNGWLDEADAAFADQRVWTRSSAGDERLVGLPAAGVGGLYLGSAGTPFSLKDEQNRTRGQIRASGLYLAEDGRAGTLQQVDLTV